MTPGEVSWKEKLSPFQVYGRPCCFSSSWVIYLGFINPTEAGAIGATALFVIVLMKRRLTLKNLSTSLLESLRISVMVLFLVAGANVFSYFLALSTIPAVVSSWMAGLQVSRYMILWCHLGHLLNSRLFLRCDIHDGAYDAGYFPRD